MPPPRYLLAALVLGVTGAGACASNGNSSDPLTELERQTGVSWVVANSAKFGNPTYLQPRSEPPATLTSGTTPAQGATSFFAKYGAIFQIVDPSNELALEDSGTVDAAGGWFASFTQREAGLPVYATRLSMLFDSKGRISGVSGMFVPKLQGFATKTSLSSAAAIAAAQADIANRYPASALSSPLPVATPELLIYPLGASPTLAYRLTLAYSNATSNGTNVSMDYIVDAGANAGAILQATTGLKTQYVGASVQTPASGVGILGDTKSFYALSAVAAQPPYDMQVVASPLNTLRYVYTPTVAPVLTSSTTTSWDTVPKDPGAGVDAYFYLGETDGWWLGQGRKSYDNAGGPIAILVHDTAPDAVDNAFWDGTGTIHVGPSSTFPHAASVDLTVMAHEFEHAVTQYAFGLVYQGQSGALDESLSDTFAEFVAHDTPPNNANFIVGQNFDPPNGLRNLADPHLSAETPGGDPDNMTDPRYYAGSADQGGVHQNTGVSNKAWFLSAFGGQDQTSGVTLPPSLGIGWAASRTLYVSLVQSKAVPPAAAFADMGRALIMTAGQIYGLGPNPGVNAVGCAWYAVGALSENDIFALGVDTTACSGDAGGDASADDGSNEDAGQAAVYCSYVSTIDAENALGVPDITSVLTYGNPNTLVSCSYSSPEVTSGPVLGIVYTFGEPFSIAEPLTVQGLEAKGWTDIGSSPVGTGGDVLTAPVAANGAITTTLIVGTAGQVYFQITSTSSLSDEVTLANEILSKL